MATDRVSIFDFVLNCLIPDKGKVLRRVTVRWLTEKFDDIHHHLVAHEAEDIDACLYPKLRGDPELHSRAIVVKALKMEKYEAVVRAFLTGSGWKEYRRTGGKVWGHELPAGLRNGDRLPQPIFTPTTKAMTGHDQPIAIQRFREEHGPRPEKFALQLFSRGSAYLEKRGLLAADTKFEFGTTDVDLYLWLGDEFFTPDSSRFWWSKDWAPANEQGCLPPSLDKQKVRDYGDSLPTPFVDEKGKPLKLSGLDPENPEHRQWVHSLVIPEEVISETAEIYQRMPDVIFG